MTGFGFPLTTDDGKLMTRASPTANDQQPTTNSQRPTANDQQPTTHSQRLRSSRQSERVPRTSRRDGYILLPIHGEGHGRGIHGAAGLEVPQRLATRGVEGDEVAFGVAREHKAAGGREHAG